MKLPPFLLLATALVLPSAEVEAIQRSETLAAEVVVLTPGEESPVGSRILIDLGDLAFLAGKEVLLATLDFTVPEGTRLLGFEVRAVTTAWTSSTVSWTTPWSSPGGDLSPAVAGASTYLAPRAVSSEMRIDITEAISRIAEGQAPNHGFLLLPAGSTDGGFRDEVAGHLDSAGDFRVTILYE